MKAGKMRALAVTGQNRSALMPDVPTLVEAGVRGYELPNWIGMYAPAGTPPAILTKLHAELVKILAMPDVKGYILKGGNEIIGSTPEEFAATYKADVAKFARIIKDARIPQQD
jgi:tripartite-type tricarboxylate transporter receptor subunit TctC